MATKTKRHSIGRDAAVAMAETKWWEPLTPHEICNVQLFTVELCCPFDVFHGAVEAAIGRPVFTHEFSSAGYDGIVAEFLGEKDAPTFDEIMEMIPEEKRILVVWKDDEDA